MPRPLSRHPRGVRAGVLAATAAAAAVLALTLSACTPGASPSPSSAPPSATATEAPTESATPTPTPTGPVLVPDGTAEDNLPLFRQVVEAVWASPDSVTGRAYVDALVAAGFDKAAMQLTPDESTVGNAAETIQFSVRWADDCLIGQVGPATGTAVAVVVPAVAEGICLIGTTRPIDW